MVAEPSATEELSRLAERRSQAGIRIAELELAWKAANQALAEARSALVDLERRGGSSAERGKLEKTLVDCEAKANEPWAQRLEGARQAARDLDEDRRRLVSENLTELVAAVEADGQAAAERLNEAAQGVLDAVAAWHRAAQQISALASTVGRMRPGRRLSRQPQRRATGSRGERAARRGRGTSAATSPRPALASSRAADPRDDGSVNGQLDEQLRRDVAAIHGLPPAAASFLTGTTIAEIETSATTFAEVLGAGGAGPEPESLAGMFHNAAGRKHERQRALIALLHNPPQPPDDQGRFASTSAGFDGGARTSFEPPVDPVAAHDTLVVELAARSQFGDGGW